MDKLALARINSLPSPAMQADSAQPADEPVFILTASQLKGLIQEAIQPLREEITALREERDQDRAEFERFKAAHRAYAVQTTNDLDALFEANLKPTAKSQPSTKTTTKKTSSHIDDLHRLMVEDRTQQVSIAKGARLLGISKERMRQLKPLIMQDGRFEVGWGQVKGKKAVVIRIRQFLK